MKKIIFAILALIAFAAPCFAELKIAATLPWIGSIAKEIGKDKVNVTVLVKPGQDPHFVEAKPSMTVAARNADIVMFNGLDLEAGYLPLIITSSRNPKIQPGQKGSFDASKYVNAIEKLETADRSMGDVHPLGNPHYHLSPSNIGRVVEGIAETLSEIDTANADFYGKNLVSFKERLKEKQAQWAGKLKGKRFIAFHKYFEYLANEFGFQITGYIESKPGIPPSSGHIAKLTETIRTTKADAILSTAYYGKKEVEYLSQKTGIKGLVVPHEVGCQDGIKDWFTLMDSVVDSLK